MNMRCRTLSALLFATIFVSTVSYGASLSSAWESPAEFSGPESAIYDDARDVLYVSNVNGSPVEKDGNGFISKLGLDGKITELNWVGGLDAPKGLAISNGKLYASNITELVEIDIEAGAIDNRYAADGAKFLNDVTADQDGNVYVSDMVGNKIYRLSGGKLSVWLESDKLENPNGLFVEGGQLIVGSWGNMAEDFSTEVPGHLKTVSLADGSVATLGNGNPVGNLDGVESDGKGNYYVSDWAAGALFHITPAGDAEQLLDLNPGSADIEAINDMNLIVIPMMKDNKVIAYKVGQ